MESPVCLTNNIFHFLQILQRVYGRSTQGMQFKRATGSGKGLLVT